MTKQMARSGSTGAIASALAGAVIAVSLPHQALAAYPPATTTPDSSAVYGLLFEQAAMWRERNRFDLAAQSLRKILESQPDNAEALFQLGSIELQNQNFDQVRTTVSRLKQIDPNDPRAAELERAMAVGQTDDAALAEARRLAAGGAYDRAIAAYQRAFRGGPPPFDLAVEYYETLAGTGAGWEEARLRLKALAERSFATSRVKFAYARVLTYNEQTRREGIVMLADLAGDPAVGQAAFEAMRQAMLWLSIGPQDRPFYESYLKRFPGDTLMRDKLAGSLRPVKQDPLAVAVNEAYKLSDQGFNDQAIARFEGVLQTDPNNVDAIAGIGIVRLRQERFAEARDQLMKAIRLAPDRQSEWAAALDSANFWSAYHEAVALRDRNDIAQAEKILRPLAERAGKERPLAQALMGDLLRRQGKQREAEAYYREALKSDPANRDALVGLYQVLTSQGRDTRSEPLLANLDATTRNRIQADGAQAAAASLRVQAKGLERSQPDRAEALYRQSIQMEPSDPWAKYELAKVLASQGRVAEAQPLIDELVASGRPESLFAAAVYYSEQQRTGEAVALLDQIPPNQRSARMNALRNDLRTAGDTDALVAAAKAGDAAARATIISRANDPKATTVQLANSALSLAKIGEKAQAMAIVRRLMARNDLSSDTMRLMFYASMEAGQDSEANSVLARMSRGTGTASRDVVGLQESLAIRQADRLREQKNLGAAYDVLVPYVSGAAPGVAARLALARVYKDSGYSEEAIQVLDGIMVSRPADAATLQEAVNIAIDLKKYERAKVWLAEAMRLQPQDPRLYMVQARLLKAQGDTSGARRALETALQLNRGMRQSDAGSAPLSAAPREQPVSVAESEGKVGDGRVIAMGDAVEMVSLNPDGRNADGETMAEFERRVAARRPQQPSTQPPPATTSAPEVLSIEPRVPLAVPAVLTSQAAPPRRQTVSLTEIAQAAPVAAPVQVAQSPLVPLRRPGDSGFASSGVTAPTAPSVTVPATPGPYTPPAGAPPTGLGPLVAPPGGPSASPGDADPLGREINRELVALKRATSPVIDAGIGFRGRNGQSGFGQLTEFNVPLKMRIPIGNAAMIPLVMPVTLSSGPVPSNSTLAQFGANAILPNSNFFQGPGSTSAAGAALDLGFEWGRLSLDVGSTPLGFPVSNVVGGVAWNQPLGDTFNLRLEASRRPVTDSLLSYAGTTDPITNTTWGGVLRAGAETIGSYDDGMLGIYAKFAYGNYTGTNVAPNQSYELTAGGYYRAVKEENQELKIGLSGTYLSYNQNLSQFTLGQGGYFSPQAFYSLTIPIDWNDAVGKFKYNAGGAIGVQNIQQNASPFFPTSYTLQNAANLAATTNNTLPVYLTTNTTSLAFALRLGFEYAVNDRTSIGGKANFDNSYQYDQGTILLFVRSAIN
ncbi:MAG: BCSC C-terminal domain-containing protein [Alphaproteobacteria bacterium]|nr:BCSC C-terminal domain-containing protein [Alphaproteobacteria bacterium]